jgi:pantoate--beta-alanine ligase
MQTITDPMSMAIASAGARQEGASVGFVPTMGALHQGHMALVRAARAQCTRVVCSVFVNPLQFDRASDLAKYPRQLEADSRLLEAERCDILFAPESGPIYADFKPIIYPLGGLDEHLEGPSRPGHFQGMINVVERLFHYVRPDRAFFGEKDRQQLTIVQHMAKAQRWPVQIVGCPTVREANGLAMSSRNTRLDEDQRAAALALYRSLQLAKDLAYRSTVKEVRARAEHLLTSTQGLRLDHFDLVHPHTLTPLHHWPDGGHAIALVAAYFGEVRLIDNMSIFRSAG